MTRPHDPTRYFAIGWREGRAEFLLLKYLHFHPEVPFSFSGIIHDDPWWPEVDGIPCVATQAFIDEHARETDSLVAMTADARQLWDRLPAPRPPLLSAGALTRRVADDLERASALGLAVGPLSFPDCFHGTSLLTDRDARHFEDGRSRMVFSAYREWLHEPRHGCFDHVLSPAVSNVASDEWFIMSGFTDRSRPKCVLEVSDSAKSYAEQFLQAMHPAASYTLVCVNPNLAERHRELVNAVRPGFLMVKSQPEALAAYDMIIIASRSCSSSEINGLMTAKTRFAQRVGDSPRHLRQAIDLSLAIHPHGTRTLRICGHYPNSLFFFSDPAESPPSVSA